MNEIQWFASLGVGGILAGMMFCFYRKDHRALEALTADFREIVQENTKAITRLCELLEARSDEASRDLRPRQYPR